MATTTTTTRRTKTVNTRSFTLTLTQGERARADRLAKRDDRSLASLVRLALKEYCDRVEAQAPPATGPTTGRTSDQGPGLWPHNPFDQHGKKA